MSCRLEFYKYFNRLVKCETDIFHGNFLSNIIFKFDYDFKLTCFKFLYYLTTIPIVPIFKI